MKKLQLYLRIFNPLLAFHAMTGSGFLLARRLVESQGEIPTRNSKELGERMIEKFVQLLHF